MIQESETMIQDTVTRLKKAAKDLAVLIVRLFFTILRVAWGCALTEVVRRQRRRTWQMTIKSSLMRKRYSRQLKI